MGNRANQYDLETWTARRKLAPNPRKGEQQEPGETRIPPSYSVSIAPRVVLHYVRKATEAGDWRVVKEIGRSANGTPERKQAFLASADDGLVADGVTVLTCQQARHAGMLWDPLQPDEPGDVTVEAAIESYLEHRAKKKGEKSANDARRRLAVHVLPPFGSRTVKSLKQRELEDWKLSLAKEVREVEE